ncbi:MAG: apolipoprotein N-acyltransferase [Deltaproteobacteria bacterium]|nr:apolipoprotein N-acyltransferase [Deltaproteobacteria bacterium]
MLGFALSILSGACVFLATAGFDVWPLAWIGLVPLLHAADRAPTARRAALYGLIAGTVTNVGGFYWVIGLLRRFAHLPTAVAVLLFLLLAAYQGLVFALFAGVVRRIRQGAPLPMALLAPLVMVTFELVVPLVFPWYLAITQAWQPHVIQVADLAGPLGVTALLCVVNGGVHDLLTGGRKRLVAGAVSLGILAGALAYGHFRIQQVAASRARAPRLPVGVVQPNVSFDEKGVENPRYRQDQLRDLQARSQELQAMGAELLLWTESAYPYLLLRAAKGDFPAGDPRRIQNGFNIPLVVGALTFEPWRDGDRKPPFNSALLLDRDGTFAARFDKNFLLVFGEYIPLLETFPWIQKLLPDAAGQFSRGREVRTLPFSQSDGTTVRLGPMICLEDILPAFGRKLAQHHPHLLVNLTNDAWYGDTSEPWQHLALAVFRAVEMRTDLVRAVNSGVSAFIDATGRVYAKTYAIDPQVTPRPADKLLAQVALVEGGHTVYARFGDVLAYACVGLSALLCFLRRKK